MNNYYKIEILKNDNELLKKENKILEKEIIEAYYIIETLDEKIYKLRYENK